MNEDLGFWRKNYWRSAFICFVVGGVLGQSVNRGETEGVAVLILRDAANLGFVVFLIAGIVRAISNRKRV